MKQAFLDNMNLVANNYQYMNSIGISDPSTLMQYVSHIFLLPTKYLAEDLKKANINLINEDPSAIFDIFEE